MKNRLHFALEIGLIGGIFGYLIFKYSYSLSTIDWAARGVPILERWWDTR